MTYVKQTWANGQLGGTPINAARLDYIETGIEAASKVKPVVADGTLYVSKSGNDAFDGFSWGTAKYTVGAAITALPAAGGTIRVGNGVYSGNIPVPSGKMVRITGNSRLTTQLTVTAGTSLFTFTGPFNNSSSFILENFTINGANGAGSRVVNISGTATFVEGEFVVRDCNILNWLVNALTFGQSNYFSTFERCYFQNNAGSLSFGLYSDFSVTNCQFSNPKSGPHIVTYGGSSGTITDNVFTPGSITGTSPDILLNSDGTNISGHCTITGNKFGPENEVAGRVKILQRTEIVNRLLCPRSDAVTIADNHFFGVSGQTAIKIDDPISGWSIHDNYFDSFSTLVNDNQSNNTGESGGSSFHGNVVRTPQTGLIPWKAFTNGGKGFSVVEPPVGVTSERAVTAIPRNSESILLINRITHSQDLTNAAWTKSGVTVTAGQTDPFGGTEAMALTRANLTGSEYVGIPIDTTLLRDASGVGASGNAGRLVIGLWAQAATVDNAVVSIYSATDGFLVATPVIQVSSTWKRYILTFSGLNSAHVFRANIYPGGLRQTAGIMRVCWVQVSDDDTDYLPTSGAVASSTVIGSRYQHGVQFAGKIITTLPTYADNAAAVTGGLTAGTLYKTATGEVRVLV